MRDDALRLRAAAHEDRGLGLARLGPGAAQVRGVLEDRDQLVIRLDGQFAGGQFDDRRVRGKVHQARHEAADEDSAARPGLAEGDGDRAALQPGRVGRGGGRDDIGALGRLGTLAVERLDLHRRGVGLRRRVQVEVAQPQEGGLVGEDAAHALPLGAVHEGQGGSGDDAGLRRLGLLDRAGLGVLVDIVHGDLLGPLHGQLAVEGLRGLGHGQHRGEEVSVAAPEGHERALLAVAGTADELDVLRLAERGEHGQILVDDMHEDPLPGLGQDKGVGRVVGGHGRADHAEGLRRAGPAAGLEVDLPDGVEGVVGEEAGGKVLRHAPEDHGRVAGIAARELAAAEQQQGLGLDLGILGCVGAAQLRRRAVELPFLRQVAPQLQVRAEARRRIGEHARHRLEHADGAALLVVGQQFDGIVDHAFGARLDLDRRSADGALAVRLHVRCRLLGPERQEPGAQHENGDSQFLHVHSPLPCDAVVTGSR